MTGWVLSRREAAAAAEAAGGGPVAERRQVLAVDGKTLRGARGAQGGQAKLVCVYDHAHQLVLTQTGVVDGDEIAAFTTALDTLPQLRGVLVTVDALHCQREHATYLHRRGGHFLFTVKGNQPALRRALAALPWGQVASLRRRHVGHGPVESRSIKVIDLDGHPPPHCSRPPPGSSRPSDGGADRPPVPHPWRSSTRSPRWTTGRRPRPARGLAPEPLDDRERRALRPRRHPR